MGREIENQRLLPDRPREACGIFAVYGHEEAAKLAYFGLYALQHPGNREWVKLQSKLMDANTGRVNLEELLDYCFEHVVFPDQGSKLTLENITLKEVEVWQIILPGFLRGELHGDYKWSDVDRAGLSPQQAKDEKPVSPKGKG